MDADLALWARLVGDVDAFRRDHWGRQPLHRASGTSFTDLLDVSVIEALLLSGARRPTFRLVRDGETLPAERSTSKVRLGGRDLDDVADVERIAGALHDGATLVLQGLQRTSIEIGRFCRALERATSHPVQANAYLSPAGAKGLAPHHDEHDVLVLQVEGTKRWEIDGLGEVETAAGDVLYLPAGARHSAAAQDATSLHLTVGILRVTRRAAITRALAALPDLDEPLPLGFARPERAEALAADLAAAFDATASSLRAADVEAVANAERTRARRRRRPLPEGQLAAVLGLDRLDATSEVVRRADCPADLRAQEPHEDDVVLELVGRQLRLPAAMGPALEVLLGGVPVVVGSLPGLDDGDRLVLVRRLVREGVVVPVARPPDHGVGKGPTTGQPTISTGTPKSR